MRNIPRPLANGLLAIAILAATTAMPLWMRTAIAADPITMEQPAPILKPGDVLTLSGKQRFNNGQIRNQLFYIGAEQVQPERIDANTVKITVPELPPGIHTVSVVKQAGNSPPNTIFSQDVEIGGEEIIATAEGVVSPGGGRVELKGVARIELTEDSSRPSTNFIIEHVSSPIYTQYFLDYMRDGAGLAGENLPQIAAENFVKIKADQAVTGDMGLKARVPQEVLDALTPELEPEIYAEFVNAGADDEEFAEMEPLRAEFNAETGEVSAPLPSRFFTAVANDESQIESASFASSESPTQIAVSAATPLKVQAIIRVAVRRRQAERDLTVSGTITTPDSATVEAGARETINLAGTFNTVVPRVLVNPTVHNPFVVTSPMSANHGGVDLRTRDGEAVSACADGVVSGVPRFDPFRRLPNGQLKLNRLGKPQSGGFYVNIRHDDGNVTTYLHLIEDSNLVHDGDRVRAGQQIARGDSTGGVSAAHLHLNYKINGARTNAVPYLRVGTPDEYYSQLSIVATINGTPVRATRRQITQSRGFEYNAPLDLSLLDLQPNKTYPMTISVVDTEGNYVPLQRYNLKIKATGLRVVLTWDKADTDVDLHVQDSKGQHAWYADMTGIPNGTLDHDDVDGFGPETFTLEPMEQDVYYDVYLHYYSDHGNGATNAKVVVYLDGELVTEFTTLLGGEDRSYHVVGTYPDKPEAAPTPSPSASPTPTPSDPPPGDGGVVIDAAAVRQPERTSNKVEVNFVAPDVIEYTLPSQPGKKLYLHLTPKHVARPQ